MEHIANREKLYFAELTHHANVSAEDSLDVIVPDAQPDILRIITAEPEVTIRSKDAENGRAVLSGSVRVNVVYSPENREGESEMPVRRISADIPFTLSSADESIVPETRVVASVGIPNVEAAIVNPRKMLIRAHINGQMRCYNENAADIPASGGIEDVNIEQLSNEIELLLTSEVKEKIFTINDDLALPASHAPLADLLTARTELAADETKLVGSKLVIKGSAYTDLLYNTVSDEIVSARLKSEYSQIMDMEGAEPDSEFEVIPFITASYVDPIAGSDYEANRVAVEIHAVGQVIVNSKKKVSYISDAYGTKYTIETQTENHSIPVIESNTNSAVLKGAVPAPNAERIISVTAGAGTSNYSGENAVTPVAVKALYSSSDGTIRTAVQKFEASSPLPNTGIEAKLITKASIGNDIEASISENAIEVRVPVEVKATVVKPLEYTPITAAGYNENAPIDTSNKPSIIVTKAKKGDTLWNVAKRFTTTKQHIKEANDLETDEIQEGTTLLIPKKR